MSILAQIIVDIQSAFSVEWNGARIIQQVNELLLRKDLVQPLEAQQCKES